MFVHGYHVFEDLFEEIAQKTGLTYDQVKFVLSVLSCFPLGHLFRILFNTQRCSPKTRHYISMFCGAGILSFCFGRQAFHLLASSLLGFMLMSYIDETVVHRYVFITAMFYLSIIHLHRMFQNGGYIIDISGPLMLATAKITYVGFDIHDAFMLKDKIRDKPDNRDKVVYRRPTLLEYLSYVFSFTTVMCGPVPEYKEYRDMIEGTQFQAYNKKKDVLKDPSPLLFSIGKFSFGYGMVGVYAMLAPYYLSNKLGDVSRLSHASLLENIIFAEMVIYLSKAKYYGPFFIGEGICNAAGLGFNGYDEHGNPCWDKQTNMKPYSLEVARNIKEMVESWNLRTNNWLKKCIYNRTSHMPLLVTWFFSALWHGFYPGYFMFFVPVGVGVYIARKIRHKVRPHFLHSQSTKFFYDVITLIATRLVISFYAAGFTMMDMQATLRFWRESYYYGHVILFIGFIIINLLPDVNKPIINPKTSTETTSNEKVVEKHIANGKCS